MNLKFLEKKWFLFLCYSLTTLFFIFQHIKGVSWDFMVYSLNGQYLFGNNFFFEWLRPPLTPLMIGMFGFFGFKAAEFIYIILVAFLHLLSSLFFAKKFNIHPNYFYILSMSFFVLINGLNVGSELLTLSMIQFFLAFLGTSLGGIFLGLAFLTRYNSFIFLPLLFFNKKIKNLLRDFLLFALTIFPWFLYNYIKTGNALHSFVNSYALNVAFRDYYIVEFNLGHLLIVMNFLIPFFVLGLILCFKKLKKEDILIFLFFVLGLISYLKVPFKTPRYLFPLILPTVYFSCIFFKRFKLRKILLLILIIVNIFTLFSVNYLHEIDDISKYEPSLNYTEDCLVMSNAWIHLNYLGREAEPFPSEDMVENELDKGKILLLYKHITEPEYVNDEAFLSKFNFIKETDDYILLGTIDDCMKKEKFIDNYLLRYKERIVAVYNKTEDISNCAILFKGNLMDICKSAKVI